MIEITSALASAWSSARSAQRKQRSRYQDLASSAAEEMEKLRNQYEEKNAYLFRSAAEKTRLAYENARAQLASRQASLAARGLTGQSASVGEQQADVQRAAVLQHTQAQQELQTAAAQQEKEYKTAWQKLQEAVLAYRRAANKKSRFGSFADAIRSLFN